MDAIILGAAGFCGQAMVNSALESDQFERVVAHYRDLPEQATHMSRVTAVAGCLTNLDYAQLLPSHPHLVFHFATSKDRLDDNLLACQNISRAVNSDTRGIIYGSSLSVYGDGPHELVTEDAEIRPQTELANNRADCESTLRECTNVPVVCLRPRMIVGTRDQYFLPKITKMFRKRVGLGNEQQRFSFIEVNDYAAVVMRLAHFLLQTPDSVAHAYNVAYSGSMSILELRKLVAPQARVFFRIPIGLSLGLLKCLPFSAAKRLAIKLTLIGRNQTIDPSRLENLIGNEVISKPVSDMIKKSLVDQPKVDGP